MAASTTSTLSRVRYAGTLVGAVGILFLAPATANAVDDDPTAGGGGCTYTDTGGYAVPIDDGQDVSVDRKIVSCRGGEIIVTTAPKSNVVRPPVIKGDSPVLAQP